MIAGIIQPSFIPWRGYFDFIDSVDTFVFLDDVQYTIDWRNRNKIKTPDGLIWVTVPVYHESRNQLISETKINYSHDWRTKQIKQFERNYRKAPFFSDYADDFFALLKTDYETIAELDIVLTKWIMNILGIKTELLKSSEMKITDTKTGRLIQILQQIKATTYISGAAAKDYIVNDMFRENNIRLEYKSYDYPEYPQLWGSFEGAVSVLDLLFNTGTEARKFLKSKTPDVVALK